MASRIMHLVVAKQVSEALDLDTIRFAYGNLLPDANERAPGKKAISHYTRPDANFESTEILDYEQFYQKYQDKMDDHVYLGYYAHLITDEIWLKDIFTKYMVVDKDTMATDKFDSYYSDYGKLNRLLIDEYKLDHNIDYLSYELDEVSDKIVHEMILGVKEDFEKEYSNLTLEILSSHEINRFIDKASKETIKLIQQKR